MKHAYGKTDQLGIRHALHYLQTKERHEVDFALAREGEIEQMIEVKNSDPHVGKGLRYFHEKYELPALQLVKELKTEKQEGNIPLLRAETFLKNLYL